MRKEYYYRVATTENPAEDNLHGPFDSWAKAQYESSGNRRACNCRGIVAIRADAPMDSIANLLESGSAVMADLGPIPE